MREASPAADEGSPSEEVRRRIVGAASKLIAEGGRDAATTRAIAAAAGVQAPTIYRLFGDKRGLLDAVADHGMAAYVADKSKRASHPDPVEDLRDGWDLHVAFGLSHPGLFAILSDAPNLHRDAPSVAAGHDVLVRRIRNIARAGRLRVSEERAVALLQSMCTGAVLTLLGQPEESRDLGLAVAARESVIATLTGEPVVDGPPGARAAAAALRATLDETTVLSKGERHLLEELLERITKG